MVKSIYWKYDIEGNKFFYSDKKMKILHREDGPAIECVNGSKEWHINGKKHREDGPAIEYVNGSKSWWINGELHREDGPAIERANGDKAWFINGKQYTEEEFLNYKKAKAVDFYSCLNPDFNITIPFNYENKKRFFLHISLYQI